MIQFDDVGMIEKSLFFELLSQDIFFFGAQKLFFDDFDIEKTFTTKLPMLHSIYSQRYVWPFALFSKDFNNEKW